MWGFVITFSDATFTQTQMDAINSGVTSAKVSAYDSHIVDKSNPHEVTYQQLGGSNPSYTKSEANTLLDEKVDKITGKGLSTNDYTNEDKAKVASAVQPSDLSSYQPKSITDAGGYFSTDTVEGALQEIGAELDGVLALINNI